MSKPRKQVILGAYVGGVNHHTVWSDPAAGSQVHFSTFRHGSHLTPGGLDESVDRVVPLLQERGSLRDNLGIPLPAPGAGVAVG